MKITDIVGPILNRSTGMYYAVVQTEDGNLVDCLHSSSAVGCCSSILLVASIHKGANIDFYPETAATNDTIIGASTSDIALHSLSIHNP